MVEHISVSLTGNDAAATALKQVNPDVAAVYPITPQTELMHRFSQFVSDGEVDTELINVESEHSAMSATVGAAAAGARAITATSANGLALMWEIVYIAASYRLPIVMPDVNRALSGPINIHCDHSDTMGCRDSGWLQIFSESSQESYDNIIQAFRIAEHKDVLLPTMVMQDGFIISHTQETLKIIADDKDVRNFVGEYKPENALLNTDKPVTVGPLVLPDYYFEIKHQQEIAMQNAFKVIEDIGKEYGKLTGREYGLFEPYKLDDAEVAIIALGSTAGTARVAIDAMRKRGVKAGMLKLRVFRPFPGKQIIDAIKHVPAVAVFDRSISFGLGGPLYNEICSAAYKAELNGKGPKMMNFIYGLGGRDITPDHVCEAFDKLVKVKESGKIAKEIDYLNLRD